jgi:hypothetical protein
LQLLMLMLVVIRLWQSLVIGCLTSVRGASAAPRLMAPLTAAATTKSVASSAASRLFATLAA